MKRELSKFENLSRKNKNLTIVNYIISSIFSLTLVGFLISMIFVGDPYNRLLSCIATLICYLLPILIQAIFKIRLSPSLYLFYLIYVTLAGFCGSCLYMYKTVPYVDKAIHFVWGYIACLIGLYLICRTKEINNMKGFTIFIVFFAVSMATASIWEIIEFLSDKLLGQTSQGVAVNNVIPLNDTMFDIICHFLGSILFALHYALEKLTHKNLGISSVINDFKTDY